MLLDYDLDGTPRIGMVLGRYWATNDIAEDWAVEWLTGPFYQSYYETETIKYFNRNWEDFKNRI